MSERSGKKENNKKEKEKKRVLFKKYYLALKHLTPDKKFENIFVGN